MKLEEAVEMGRFCGLDTVEECLRNVYHHQNMFSYKEFPEMWRELEEEYLLWKDGELVLDFATIDANVAKQYKQMEADMMDSTPSHVVEVDF